MILSRSVIHLWVVFVMWKLRYCPYRVNAGIKEIKYSYVGKKGEYSEEVVDVSDTVAAPRLSTFA